jgi:predicted dehydrogenase
MIDIILQIQGKPKRIIPLNKCSGEDVTSKDFGMAVLEYENGVSFAKTNALELGGFARRQIVVTGTKGTIEIKPLEIRTQDDFCYPRKTVYTSEDWGDMGDVTECEPFNRYEGTIVAFAEYVKGEKENPYTYDYEEELFETVLKCCNAEH